MSDDTNESPAGDNKKQTYMRRSSVQTNSGRHPGLIIEEKQVFPDVLEQIQHISDHWQSHEQVVKEWIEQMLAEVEHVTTTLCGCELEEARKTAEPMTLAYHAAQLHNHLLRARHLIDSDDKWLAMRALMIVGDAYATMWVSIHEADAVRGRRHRLNHRTDWDQALIEWVRIAKTERFEAECDRIIAERYDTTPGAVKGQRRRKKIKKVQ